MGQPASQDDTSISDSSSLYIQQAAPVGTETLAPPLPAVCTVVGTRLLRAAPKPNSRRLASVPMASFALQGLRPVIAWPASGPASAPASAPAASQPVARVQCLAMARCHGLLPSVCSRPHSTGQLLGGWYMLEGTHPVR